MNGLMMKYFVLNPSKKDAYGAASRKAMEAYANAIIEENEQMAIDLVEWIDQIDPTAKYSFSKAKRKKRK